MDSRRQARPVWVDFQGICGTAVLPSERERRYCFEENISAEEDSSEKGAWLPQENGYRQRPQGPRPSPRQGQSKALRVIGRAYTATHIHSG